MSRLRVLNTDEELHEFGQRYAEVSRHTPPAEYLNHATVYGYFRRGEMIGGTTLSDRAPFRVIEDLPAERRREVEARLDLDDLVESGCVWLRPEYRGLSSTLFWWQLSAQTARTGRRWRLGATSVPGLAQIYQASGGTQVYGSVQQAEGETRRKWLFTNETSQWRQAIVRSVWYKICRSKRPRAKS